MRAKVRRWGNSLGLVVPVEVARERGLRDGDWVEFDLRRRIPTPEELSGTVRLPRPLLELLREMEEGWDDY